MIDLTQELVRALASQEVTERIREIVREAVREPRTGNEVGESLLDTKKAAELLSMTPAAVRKAAERGTIPCVRLGRKLLFRRDELIAATRR
jgi:excisionase family DNA binding protein